MFQKTEVYQNQAECRVLSERQPWKSFCLSEEITDRAEVTQPHRCNSAHEGVKDLTPEIEGTLIGPCQNSRACGGFSCFIPKSDVTSLPSQEVLEPGLTVLELKNLTQKFFEPSE